MGWNPFRSRSFPEAVRQAALRVGFSVLSVDDRTAHLTLDAQPCRVELREMRPILQSLPEKWPPLLDDFLAAVRDSTRATAAARASLAAVQARLRPRIGLPHEIEDAAAPGRAIVPGLVDIHLVVDEPDGAWTVRDEHLDEWSAEFDELWQAALDNLRSASDREKLRSRGEAGRVLVYETGDSYDASRMLLLRELLLPFPADGVVVSVPTRDILLCVPLESRDSLDALNAMFLAARGLHVQASCGITDQPLWFDGFRWELLPVTFHGRRVDVSPSERFVRVMQRLSQTRALLT